MTSNERRQRDAERRLGDFIHEILHVIYVAEREKSEQFARAEGITIEQMAAAGIARGLLSRYAVKEQVGTA